MPGIGNYALIDALSDEAIDAFAAFAGPEAGPSTLLMAELRQLGGALGRAAPGAGALAKLDAGFVLNAVGMPIAPGSADAINADLDRLTDAMRPWHSAGGYINFADRPCDVEQIFTAEICARLRAVKDRWDPDGVIRANHMPAVGG